jgi:transposase
MLSSMVQKTIAMSEGRRVHVKVPSCCLSCESSATLKLFKQSTALLQTNNCRKAWGKQLTGTEQGSPHCLVWNSHKCRANTATESDKYKQETEYGYMQRCLPVTYPAKAALPLSSSNNQLHSCRLSIAEKCGANNQQEQSKAPLTIWYEIHTSAKPIQQLNPISTSKKQSMPCQKEGGCMWRCLPAAYPAKAVLPLSSSNNWLHSCRLSIAEKHGANNQQEQSKAPLTFWYEIHTSAQAIQQPICRTNNVAQQFSCLTLDNGTEGWRKVVLDNLWRSHIDWHWLALIGIDWHPFGVLEADEYCQNYHWQFGDQLIFIYYIFMKKNEFKLL